ncbi:MAG TPA: alanine--glyoxylate aminotransferase family protein [Thermoanaerobaculia bacterium]|nr:alanine--glyoxylate aminotransferase family protein [Thermoanaerobaculia bacterium]
MSNFDSTTGNAGQVRFFNPGPVWVRPQVLQALTGPMLSHRSQAFMDLYGRILDKLPKVFRTTPGRAHTLASSATGVWEAALVSCVEGPVLSLGNGAFSEKWGEMSQRLGLETDTLKAEWGKPISPDDVKAKLAAKKYAAVTVVHSETSTGVLNDLPAIAKVVRENSDALVFADCVTSVAGTKVETDAWGLDVVLTGSQKAFALPPGLALFAMSERTLAAAKKKKFRGLYLDLVDIDAFAQKKQTPTTPCLSLLYALDVQLDHILAEGIENRWARHEAMRAAVADWAGKNGFSIFAQKGAESPTVTSMIPPAGVNAEELNKALKAAKWTTGSGYGKLKATNVRIGHMGDVDVLSVQNYLKAHEEAVAALRAKAAVPA